MYVASSAQVDNRPMPRIWLTLRFGPTTLPSCCTCCVANPSLTQRVKSLAYLA